MGFSSKNRKARKTNPHPFSHQHETLLDNIKTGRLTPTLAFATTGTEVEWPQPAHVYSLSLLASPHRPFHTVTEMQPTKSAATHRRSQGSARSGEPTQMRRYSGHGGHYVGRSDHRQDNAPPHVLKLARLLEFAIRRNSEHGGDIGERRHHINTKHCPRRDRHSEIKGFRAGPTIL